MEYTIIPIEEVPGFYEHWQAIFSSLDIGSAVKFDNLTPAKAKKLRETILQCFRYHRRFQSTKPHLTSRIVRHNDTATLYVWRK